MSKRHYSGAARMTARQVERLCTHIEDGAWWIVALELVVVCAFAFILGWVLS